MAVMFQAHVRFVGSIITSGEKIFRQKWQHACQWKEVLPMPLSGVAG